MTFIWCLALGKLNASSNIFGSSSFRWFISFMVKFTTSTSLYLGGTIVLFFVYLIWLIIWIKCFISFIEHKHRIFLKNHISNSYTNPIQQKILKFCKLGGCLVHFSSDVRKFVEWWGHLLRGVNIIENSFRPKIFWNETIRHLTSNPIHCDSI